MIINDPIVFEANINKLGIKWFKEVKGFLMVLHNIVKCLPVLEGHL